MECFGTQHHQYTDDTYLYIFASKEELIKGIQTTERCAHALYNRQTGSPPSLASLLSNHNPIRVSFHGQASSSSQQIKAEDFGESIPSRSCGSLEYSSTDNQRMWNSLFIQKTSENTPVQHRLQKYLSCTLPRLRMDDPHIGVVDTSFRYLHTYLHFYRNNDLSYWSKQYAWAVAMAGSLGITGAMVHISKPYLVVCPFFSDPNHRKLDQTQSDL